MIPGISARPSASTVSLAERLALPTSRIFPSLTARSPRFGGEPRPSTSSALRITRSCIAPQYTCRSMFDLKGKTAVVTGGAKGIGAATRRLLEKAGAQAHLLDIENGCGGTSERQDKTPSEKRG